MKRNFVLTLLVLMNAVSVARATADDTRNQRFLKNLVAMCDASGGSAKAACTGVHDAFTENHVAFSAPPIDPVLKKVIMTVAKKVLLGLGNYVSAGVGVTLTSEQTAVEIFDAGNESIPKKDRSRACARDMATIEPGRFITLLKAHPNVADACIALLSAE